MPPKLPSTDRPGPKVPSAPRSDAPAPLPASVKPLAAGGPKAAAPRAPAAPTAPVTVGGWAEKVTLDGLYYYYNEGASQLSWDKPDVLKTAAEKVTESGDWCWVRDAKEAWVPGRQVKKLPDGSLECTSQSGAKVILDKADPVWAFTLSSLNKLEDDIVMLEAINEGQIIHNLRERYKKNMIYTWCGANKNVLISMNPFQQLPLYSPEIIQKHAHPPPNLSLEPHVFDIAQGSYKSMSIDRLNQCVLISGESGAGKTEATKQCLSFLADVAESASNLETKILLANPVLEAFGNAKTLRNNNSSRFGKWIEVHFDEMAHISGARIDNFLLEKSRVAFQGKGERNYHIFYQLFQSTFSKKYGLTAPESFRYLNQSGCIKVEGVDDAGDFQEVVKSMQALDFSEDEKKWMIETTIGVLYLGNLTFTEVASTGGSKGSEVSNKNVLKSAAGFLGVTEDALNKAVTFRSIEVKTARTEIPLKPIDAIAGVDALAKSIYGNMFNWLVSRVNSSLVGKNGRFVGILDIFGFEIFEKNSFEQLCINFANEKLQQHFNRSTFKQEEEVYVNEGVPFEPIKFVDNQIVLDLLEKKPIGILQLLDEEIRLPEGSDINFMKKCDSRHEKHPNYVIDRKLRFSSDLLFCINHYAGSVVYDTNEFMNKNKDTLFADMYDMMSKSSFTLTQTIFPVLDSRVRRTYSLASQFCKQLNDLMTLLYSTEPRYIRCIKPTAFKRPNDFNSVMSIEQLRYSGVFEAVKIRKQGYPFRYLHKSFLYRYRCITLTKEGKWPVIRNLNDPKKGIPELLSMRKEDFSGIKIGKTMALYKAEQNRLLELMRNLALDRLVPTMQRVMRGHLAREMKRRLKKCGGLLDHALKVGNDIILLDDAIEKASSVIGTLSILFDYTPKRVPEALELRRKLIEWTKVVEIFKQLLPNDINDVYGQLGAAIVRADTIMEIPHTKDQTEWYNKATKAVASCVSAKIEPAAKDALYILDKDKMVELSEEAAKVGYKSQTIDEINELLALPEQKFVQLQLKKAVELNDPVRRINREIALVNLYLQNNEHLFPFDAFGQLRHPVEFANQKLLTLNRKELAEGFLKWTATPLHTSMTQLPPALVRDARQIHKSILGFMQDRKYSNIDDLAVDVIRFGITQIPLRNEIYCQIMKQLSGNPNYASIQNGWLLMWLCVNNFPPSDGFENFLLIFVKKYAPPGEGGKYVSAIHAVKYEEPKTTIPAVGDISKIKSELNAPWKRSRFSDALPPTKAPAPGTGKRIKSTKKVTAKMIYGFEAIDENMVNVTEGEAVEVIEQDGDDWWLVKRKNGSEGYVPAGYVQLD